MSTDLTPEELLALAQQDVENAKLVKKKRAPRHKPDEYYDDVIKFISDLGLKTGRFHVRPKPLYLLYNKWSKKSYTQFAFIYKFNQVFFPLTKRGMKYYKLNMSPMDIQHTIAALEAKYDNYSEGQKERYSNEKKPL